MKGLFSDDGVYITLNDSGNKVWLDYITKYEFTRIINGNTIISIPFARIS